MNTLTCACRAAWPGVVDRYRPFLDLQGEAITLLEGNTPLIPVPRLAEWICPGIDLYLKYEGLNPTGSFKDRGMTAAMTQAVHDGAQAVICASTGNTAAAAAAYAARSARKCFVLIPDGKVALGKLAGAIAYGAKVIQIRGSFDDGLNLVREIAEKTPVCLVNSVNPARLEGQKTSSFEIIEALGDAPDWQCLPVGNAGNISAYWLGYQQYLGLGRSSKNPKIVGAQAEGAAPIVLGHVVPHPETKATAIRIGNPARWKQAEAAIAESGGHILAVSDDEIFEAYRMAASLEGVFCEPSSATGLAGFRKARLAGAIQPREGEKVVAILTGHGLKDADSAIGGAAPPDLVDATYDDLMGGDVLVIVVRVPATTANLGPGFDCIGLALDLWNTFELRLDGPAESVEVETLGEGADFLPRDANHLVAKTMIDETWPGMLPADLGMRITCRNNIPAGSGLGSSSTALIAGLIFASALSARAVYGDDHDRILAAVKQPQNMDRALKRAIKLEGHGDNVAPALLGGLQLVVAADPIIVHRVPHAPIRAVVCVPKYHFLTSEARAALPGEYPRSHVISNIGKAMLVLEALRLGDLDLLAKGIGDRIHEPFRIPLIPGAAAAKEAALAAGAKAACLSGAGPGMIAFGDGNLAAIGQAMVEAYAQAGLSARFWELDAIEGGTRIGLD